MRPAHTRIVLPQQGFSPLADEADEGSCDDVPDSAWTTFTGKGLSIYAAASGPNGSGRIWSISVGLSSVEETRPGRGICFRTTTIGWRTLRNLDQAPLKWLDDEDGDGAPELIIWDSFPLADEPTAADYAIVAWVYRINATGMIRLDWDLSRRKAAEIALAYRSPLESRDPRLEQRRSIAAEALEAFADGRCRPANEVEREEMNHEGHEEH